MKEYLIEITPRIHSNALEKGFWEKNNKKQKLMLIITELSEAVEADRINKHADLVEYHRQEHKEGGAWIEGFKTHVKDSFEDEIADALIRAVDYCAYFKIDLNLLRDYDVSEDVKAETDLASQIFYLSGVIGLLNSNSQDDAKILRRFIYFTYWFCTQRWHIDIYKHIHLKMQYNETRQKLHGKGY